MAIYTKEQAQALLKKVLSYSKADECEVSLFGSDGGNVRYALKRGFYRGRCKYGTGLAVTSVYGKKAGSATIMSLTMPL
jgi:hypothetical protein